MPPPALQSFSALQYTAAASLGAVVLFYVFGPTLIPDPAAETRPRKGAVGLSNAANECFINSVLQALAGSSVLKKYLDSQVKPAHIGEPSPEDSCQDADTKHTSCAPGPQTSDALVTKALKEILDTLHDRRLNGRTASPQPFIRSLEHAFQSRLSHHQQDAQELLQLVTERVAEELKAPKPPQSLVTTTTKQLPFQGFLESQVQCETCRFKPKAQRSAFTMLTLHVPHKGSSTLDECFDGLLKQEYIDGYKCDGCRLKQAMKKLEQQMQHVSSEVATQQLDADMDAIQLALKNDPESTPELTNKLVLAPAPLRRITKHTRISEYPVVLTVHLSRSIYSPGSFSSKNTASVAFGERLRLGGLAESHHYLLMSIVTHRGGHNSGHYETFRRQATDGASCPLTDSRDESTQHEPPISPSVPSDTAANPQQKAKTSHSSKWWAISDAKVRECKTRDVIAAARDVYILIYEKTT